MNSTDNKGFSWMGLLFAPSYYAGYGDNKKGLILALVGAIPFLGIGAFIYGGINAKKDLAREGKFNWVNGILAYVILSVIASITYGAMSASIEYLEGGGADSSMLTEISGIWRGVSDGAMVTINLGSKDKHIDINNNRFQVDVKNIDSQNHIVTLNVRTNQGIQVWTIKQVYEDDRVFTLLMTLSNGTQDRLAFIRNIQ